MERLPLKPKKLSTNNRFGKLDVVIFIILMIYVLSIAFPFYYAFVISVSSTSAYLNTNILLFPKEITFDAYLTVFQKESMWNGLGITLILLFGGTLYQLFFTVITGYALSRDKWFGKNFVMNMILVTMFFGGGLIPYTILMKDLGLHNTFWVMMIPGAIDTFNMLLMRNYFASLPKEMEESARIDGANDVQIFIKVYLPLSLPMLATIGLFFAVGNWNSWYNAMMFVPDSSLWPLQQVLRNLINIASSSIPIGDIDVDTPTEGVKMAAIFFTIIPMMCFYPFLQRFFVKGIVVGAIKG